MQGRFTSLACGLMVTFPVWAQKTDHISGMLELPEWNYNGIQPAAMEGKINNIAAITPLSQILEDNGYYTIHCGKAHFGDRMTPGENPKNRSFDVNIAGGANGAPGSYLGTRNFGEGFRLAVSGLEKYHGKDFFSDRNSDAGSYSRNEESDGCPTTFLSVYVTLCRTYSHRSEQNDLVGYMPDKVRELSSELTDYLMIRNVQRPSLKATHEMLPYPNGSK